MFHLKNQSTLFNLVKQNYQKIAAIQDDCAPVWCLIQRNYYNQHYYYHQSNKRLFNNDSIVTNQFCFISNRSQSTIPVALKNIIPLRRTKITDNDLPENIRFRPCETIGLPAKKRPLVILLGWMMSKEEHLEKFRKFWFERGFDVLSIRTLPTHLLIPVLGGRNNALTMYNFLNSKQPYYDEIIVHAFSVGGYQLAEFIHVLEENLGKEKRAQEIYDSIKGYVIDSVVYTEDCAEGLSRAITQSTIYQPVLSKSIQAFLKLTKPLTFDRYLRISSVLIANEKHKPGLVLFSTNDLVSNDQRNHQLYRHWKSNNDKSDFQCWDDSPHVLHYKNHREDYVNKVDAFLKRLGY